MPTLSWSARTAPCDRCAACVGVAVAELAGPAGSLGGSFLRRPARPRAPAKVAVVAAAGGGGGPAPPTPPAPVLAPIDFGDDGPAVPVGPGRGRGGGRGNGGRGRAVDPGHGLPWLDCTVDNVRFILDPYTGSIGCHCKVHVGCKVNRVNTKLPIGYFGAWAAIAALPEYDTQAKHFAARLDRYGPDAPLAYEKRVAIRAAIVADPRYALLVGPVVLACVGPISSLYSRGQRLAVSKHTKYPAASC